MNGRLAVGVSNCRPLANVLETIADAEQLGADCVFVAEDIGCRDSFALCTLAAQTTSTIKLAVGVANPYTRSPMSLAMAAATLDEASDGRAVLGLGSSSPDMLHQMGLAQQKPLRVMREAVEVVRALLTGESVTHNGEIFRYRDSVLGARPVQPRVPIYFAAMGPQILRLAGRIADGVILNVGASPAYVRWAVSQVTAGVVDAERSLSDVTIAAWMSVYRTDRDDQSQERARQWLARVLSIPRQGELLLQQSPYRRGMLDDIRNHVTGYPHSGDARAAARYVSDELLQDMVVLGDAPHVRGRIEEYRRAGVDLPIVPLSTMSDLGWRDKK